MGFGLCTFGYSLLVFFLFGGDTIGYLLLTLGLKKLGEYDKKFKLAHYFAFGLIFVGLIRLVGLANEYLGLYEQYGTVYNVLQWVQSFSFVLFSLGMHTLFFDGVIGIIRSGRDKKFERLATFAKYVSILIFVAYGFASSFGAQFMRIVWISYFALIAFNTFFMFKCYASITTESKIQQEKDEFGIVKPTDDDDDDDDDY